jgi:hypothetical protein
MSKSSVSEWEREIRLLFVAGLIVGWPNWGACACVCLCMCMYVYVCDYVRECVCVYACMYVGADHQ